MAEPPPTLRFAELKPAFAHPTSSSTLIGAAWAMIIVETVYKGSVVTHACSKTNIYVWERFSRNVGDPALFQGIDAALLVFGALFAIAALLHPKQKRWAAIWALTGQLFLLATTTDFVILSRFWLHRN